MKKLLFGFFACLIANVAAADVPSCIAVDAIKTSLTKSGAKELSSGSFTNSLYRDTHNGNGCITTQNVFDACLVGYTIHQLSKTGKAIENVNAAEFNSFLNTIDTDVMVNICKTFVLDVVYEHNNLIRSMQNPLWYCKGIGQDGTTGDLSFHGYDTLVDNASVCNNVGENLIKCIVSEIRANLANETRGYTHCCLILNSKGNVYSMLRNRISRFMNIKSVSEFPSFNDMCEVIE